MPLTPSFSLVDTPPPIQEVALAVVQVEGKVLAFCLALTELLARLGVVRRGVLVTVSAKDDWKHIFANFMNTVSSV